MKFVYTMDIFEAIGVVVMLIMLAVCLIIWIGSCVINTIADFFFKDKKEDRDDKRRGNNQN